MTWLWNVEDIHLRVAFARTISPTDFFTLLALLIVRRVTAVVGLLLKPVDTVLRLFGRVMLTFVFWLLVLLIITAIWWPIWAMLVGSSWLWLKYPGARPFLLLPGISLALFAQVFIILVPDPQKAATYTTLSKEWPLSWHLWRPTEAYFQENPPG